METSTKIVNDYLKGCIEGRNSKFILLRITHLINNILNLHVCFQN